MCERGRKGLPVMCAGQFGVVGIHSGCANGHIDGAGVALGVTVRRADYDRRCAARVAAGSEKLERVDTIECPLIAAERFGDGSTPVAQTDRRCRGMSGTRRGDWWTVAERTCHRRTIHRSPTLADRYQP